jgi:hypothetical protein
VSQRSPTLPPAPAEPGAYASGVRALSEMLTLRDAGVSEEALIEAEGRLGLRLPEDLREFLKVSDAGSLTELVSKLESGSDPFP